MGQDEFNEQFFHHLLEDYFAEADEHLRNVRRHLLKFEDALRDPQVAALLAQYGTAAAFLGPAAYAGYWQDSFAEWRRLAKAAGIYRQAD